MARARCRKFTLLDGMILVAGLALGFAGLLSEYGDVDTWSEAYSRLDADVGYVLMLLSGLMVILRLRRPRPSLRRVACQPGAVACFSAAAYGLLFDLQFLYAQFAELSSSRPGDAVGRWIWWLISTPANAFWLIVPIFWILMILARRWRREPGWIDRSGMVIGWSWIAWGLAYPFLP